MSNNTFTKSIIANMLCISEKRAKQLTDEGVLNEVVPGHYKMTESVQSYIKYLQNQVSDKDYTSDYNTEKAKLTKAKREKEEAELSLMKNQLHKADDIEFVMGKMLISFKSKMLVIPQKALPKIYNNSDKNEILAILKKEIVEALDELSEYDENLFNDNGN